MKTTKLTMKTLTIVLLAGLGLGGCVAVPAYGPGAYGPPAYSPPVVVVPAIRFGVGYGGYGGHGGHGYYGGRGRW